MDMDFHPYACPKVWGKYHMKHDQLVSIYAAMAREVGIKAEFFDLEIDNGLRPGDWIETDDQGKHFAILCDLTITAGGLPEAKRAVTCKRGKYKKLLADNPELKLDVVSLAATGEWSGETWTTLQRWNRALIAQRRSNGLPIGYPMREVVAAAAYGFAAVMTHQIRKYTGKARLTRTYQPAQPTAPNGLKRPRTTPQLTGEILGQILKSKMQASASNSAMSE